MHAELDELVELLRGLDALGDEARAGVVGERHEGTGERSASEVDVDAGDEVAVEFDELRLELEDVGQAGEPGAGVVDRKPHTVAPERGERLRDRGVVVDRVVFGELDDDSTRRIGAEELGEGERAQGGRGDVDRHEGRGREPTQLIERPTHGRELELHAEPGAGGVGEPLVGGPRRRRAEARECLAALRLSRDDAHDRLEGDGEVRIQILQNRLDAGRPSGGVTAQLGVPGQLSRDSGCCARGGTGGGGGCGGGSPPAGGSRSRGTAW